MRQVLIRRGVVTVEDVPAPLVEEGHVLVEVAYSFISPGTEISNVESSAKPLVRRALEQPDQVKQVLDQLRRQGIQKTVARVQGKVDSGTPTGYSCAGRVIQVGAGVTDLHPGDLVACAGAGYASHAEIVLVPRLLVVPVPAGCDLRLAATVTLGAIALQGVRRAEPRLGDIVAVIGLGLLGQLTVQLLKAAGCQVIGFDVDERRVGLAGELGADHAFVSTQVDVLAEVRHRTGGRGVDVTVITAASSSDALVQQAMELTRKKGRVVVVGAVGLGLKRSPFYEKELDFLISCSYGPGRYDESYEERGRDYPYAYVRWTENRNMAEYLRLVAAGSVRLDAIIEKEYDLGQAEQAYTELREPGRKPLGVLLRYPWSSNGHGEQSPKLATTVILERRVVTGKIRIAIVGAGNFARAIHLPNLQRLADTYQVRAIVTATGAHAKAVARQFGADYASTDYADVLADPDVDAVLIATRHHLHAAQVVAALRAGKHVYCEKPLALNEDELGAILACYDLTRAEFAPGGTPPALPRAPVLTVGFNRRYAPAAQKLKAALQGRQNPLIALYRVNAGYLPGDQWVHGEQGGGRIIGEACHMLDFCNFLVGSDPVEITTSGAQFAAHSVLRGDDNFSTTLRYQDGSICTLLYTASGNVGLGKERIEAFFDGKTGVITDFQSLELFGVRQGGWKSTGENKGHYEALAAFGRALRRGEWPVPLKELVLATEESFVVDRAIRPGEAVPALVASPA